MSHKMPPKITFSNSSPKWRYSTLKLKVRKWLFSGRFQGLFCLFGRKTIDQEYFVWKVLSIIFQNWCKTFFYGIRVKSYDKIRKAWKNHEFSFTFWHKFACSAWNTISKILDFLPRWIPKSWYFDPLVIINHNFWPWCRTTMFCTNSER